MFEKKIEHGVSLTMLYFDNLESHTGRGAECSQDRRCDRCNQLHNKLSCLFFIHNFLLSFLPFYLFTFNLILGAALRLNCPQVEV